MNKEVLKNQLLENIDSIVDIIADGNTAEIKKNKDGILILEVFRKNDCNNAGIAIKNDCNTVKFRIL